MGSATKRSTAKGRTTARPGKRKFVNYPRAGKGPVRRWLPSWRFLLGGFLFAVAVVVGVVVTAYATTTIPEPASIAISQTTTVYYSDGKTVMGRFVDEANRELIPAEEIPQVVRDAIVAAEDRSFYENAGISVPGMARAFWTNLRHGTRQGGSTITQQYAERYYTSGTTSDYVGKFKEALLAVKLAQEEDKDEILANYINTIYFGRGTNGIQTAARAYFGVDAKDLTLSQAALIAGIIPSPTKWDPRFDPDKAKERWNYVLDGMVLLGTLDPTERTTLEFPETKEFKQSNTLAGPKGYILDEVRKEIVKKTPFTTEELDTAGFKVVTTIDVDDQKAVQATMKDKALFEGSSKNMQTAVVSIDPSTGAIRAMYGGKDYVKIQRNRVTQDKAQAGSTFKPFTLVAALEAGKTLDDRLNGSNLRKFDGIKDPVRNFANGNWGWVSLLKATEHSINTAFVDLNLEVTPAATRDVAIRAGIPEDADSLDVAANVLGVSSVRALDMAAAYSTFANEGMRTEPYLVQSIAELNGNPVYEGGSVPKRAFEAEIMADTTYALTQVVEKGSGQTAKSLDRPVAGKTGTSNSNKSAWFVGYTPQLVTAVSMYQIGEDGIKADPISPFRGYDEITGGSAPLDVWTSYMTAALEGEPVLEFPERTKPVVKTPPTPTETETEKPTEEPTEKPTEEPTQEPDSATVPGGLIGTDENSARNALRAAGLEPVVSYQESDQPKGSVIAVQPGEGTQVPVKSSIVLVVSSGPPPAPDPTTPPPGDPAPPATPPGEPAQQTARED